MKATPLLALGLMLVAGCTEPTQAPPPSLAPDCPEPYTRTKSVDYVSYNLTLNGDSGSGSVYTDFGWAAPDDTPLFVDVRAEWDAGTLDDKTLQLRLVDSKSWDTIASARGTSPLILQFNTTATESSLRVHVEHSPETVAGNGAGASLVEMEVSLTVTQTVPCLT